MFLHMQNDEQITGRSAKNTRRPFPGKTNLRVIVDTGWNLHFFGDGSLNNFLAPALSARLGDNLSGAITVGTGRYIDKRAEN